MAEKKKVTEMLLRVHDLECSKCYKKVKKILCKFPQIQDQVYDEKNNTVKIKVVCCSPEKIRDKICCKGRETIKSIEILKPKPVDPKPKPVEPEPKPKPVDPKPKPEVEDPIKTVIKTEELPPSLNPLAINIAKGTNYINVPKPPAPGPVPIGFCCSECSEGRGRGPCYNPCYGQPVRYYDGYCGRPVYDSWGGGGYRGNYGSRCSEYYFNEDNSQGCTIL